MKYSKVKTFFFLFSMYYEKVPPNRLISKSARKKKKNRGCINEHFTKFLIKL